MISYAPFFKLLKQRGITQYQLDVKYDISRGTITSLRENRNMNLSTIEQLCKTLKCRPDEVFEFVDDADINEN